MLLNNDQAGGTASTRQRRQGSFMSETDVEFRDKCEKASGSGPVFSSAHTWLAAAEGVSATVRTSLSGSYKIE